MNSFNSAVISPTAEIPKLQQKPIEIKPEELVFNEEAAKTYLEERGERGKNIFKNLREKRREAKALKLASLSIASLSEEKPLSYSGDAETSIPVATTVIERAKKTATIDHETLDLVSELLNVEDIVPLHDTGIEQITVEKVSHAYSEVLREDSLALRAIHQHVAA